MEVAAPGTCGYLAIGFTAFFLVYAVFFAFVHLYFSPLADFPGPKLAAATGWCEFYFDVIKRGKYIYEIEKMHHEYGNDGTLYPRHACEAIWIFQVRLSESILTS